MRGQDRSGLSALRMAIGGSVLGGALVLAVGALSADGPPNIVPRVTGGAQPMQEIRAPALARPITDDKRKMRNYPEQPPVIPHSVEGYQLSLKTTAASTATAGSTLKDRVHR